MIKKIIPLLILLFSLAQQPLFAQDKMIAHFIDVGQGDATLLEFPCGLVLIDAGAQDDEDQQKLITYLSDFFDEHPQFNHTIDLIIVTHPHVDHNRALQEIVETFTVKNYIDNGSKKGSGRKNQNWMHRNVAAKNITYNTYPLKKIIENNNKHGITDEIIDPLDCGTSDPRITLLSGGMSRKPAAWSASEYKNLNNHSVVVKVEFGQSSFLFTGDLEEEGIAQLLEIYNNGLLDVDILRVGHHGSGNATTEELLDAVTPSHAVISCGNWFYGRETESGFNTYNYGHPRITVLDKLSAAINGNRNQPVTIKAAEKARVFKNYTITKRIYTTPKDNTIQIAASADGSYRVSTEN